MALVAYQGSTNSHGGGGINSSVTTVIINGKAIATVPDLANPDALCPTIGGAHCSPSTSTGSSTVFAGGKPVHRISDLRTCGATTVTGSNNVFAG